MDLVMGLNFAVDLLLLLGANSLSGHPPDYKRAVLAAALGGIYGGVCLLPGFTFLGNSIWRLVFLGLMAVIAFGWDRNAFRRGALFVVLSMALGGIALGLYQEGFAALIAAASGLFLLCLIGFPRGAGGEIYRKVELEHRGRRRILVALHDTGNQLRDPVTGRPVLVVGPDVARELMELSPGQLASPMETMLSVPGLRLIPYRAVGQSAGMLLAVRMDEVRMDGKKWDGIVAFAPEKFGNNGYEALAGGVI